MATQKGWGFDVRELSTKIRPQDDFYHYVNKTWMEKNPIPKNESRWGTFTIIRYDTEKKVYALLQELAAKKTARKGSAEQMVRDFYRSGMDVKTRNALGIAPLMPFLKDIQSLTSPDELTALFARLQRLGVDAPFGSAVDQDAKNATRYAFLLHQDGLGMPEREYYLKDDTESVRVRSAYKVHVKKLFQLMGCSPTEAERKGSVLLNIETQLARASMTKEDLREPDKWYHKMTIVALKKQAPRINWKEFFTLNGASGLSSVIVMQPAFLSEVSKMIDSVSLDDWKTYLSWHLVNDYSGALSDRFIRESFNFYGKVLSGTATMRPLWRRVLGTVNGGLGELIGKVYVERHFTKEAKRKMEHLVADLFTAFERRIKSLDWMSQTTKRKALQKLRAINTKIGYPRRWKSYTGLTITPKEFVGNIVRMNDYEHRRAIRKLSRPIDRDEWFMYPQTVNAYFAENLNDIVFPAAILQPPFFDPQADDAVNYGCIGAVIGHEITHGFDDQGSQYDSKGNLNRWWLPEDRKRFNAKAKKVENQFNRYTVADKVHVNGKLTLGENIADLGGLSIAYDAYQLQLARTGRSDIDGLTPEQRFCIAFAVFERENSRPEGIKTQVLTDPHAPGVFRINGPMSNFSIFYDAFDVKKGDAMYRSPKERELVW